MATPQISRQPSLSGAITPKVAESTAPDAASTLAETVPGPPPQGPPGGVRFWLIFISIMVSTFLSAIDMTSVPTILPTIVADLHGNDFVWVGSAFGLASTAVLPLSGGLSQVFGRRPVMLGFLLFFGVGSGLVGGSKSMKMLIAARAVQGVGGGGILSLSEIIVADLVPLRWRGIYYGLLAAVWAVAAAVGPPVGGAFAEADWRWLFYMNIPLTAIAMVLVFFFLQVKAPKDDFKSKMKRMDWTGNFIIIASSTITIIALTWGGVKYAWSSYQVLVPLILGIVGIFVFFVYEAMWATDPVVPWVLVSNRTSLSGYIGTFIHSVVAMMVLFYMPVYLQATKTKTPVDAAVGIFGLAFTIPPAAMIAGATVAMLKLYRPQNYIAWVLISVGVGLLSLLEADTSKGKWVGFQIITGFGTGILYSVTTFPVLSALPLSETAHAMALFTFLRSFAQTWGVTIGATILQNELKKRLPGEFLALFPADGVEIAYAAIPIVPSLQEPVKTQVRVAFADSLQVIWYVAAGLSVAGFASVVLMKELPMQEVTDEDWGLKEKKKSADAEKDTALAVSEQPSN